MSSIVNSVIGGVSGNTGGAGLNYEAGKANVVSPATQAQADEQYANMQNAFSQQGNFLTALQNQGGLGNQASVFNQMQGVANGTGPNPAQAMLNNTAGNNISSQAALMAGQRGAGANVGLMARQAGQVGANIQQQAAGQGAALQAQQSLGALNQMGGMATNQVNQQSNATNALMNASQSGYNSVMGGINNQNQANVGAMSSQNSANAGVAGVAAKGQNDLMGNLMGGAGSAMMMLADGGAVKKDPGVIDSVVNTVKSAFEEPPKKSYKQVNAPSPEQADAIKRGLEGKADGGMIKHYDQGGAVTSLELSQGATSSPMSSVGKYLQNNPSLTGSNNPSDQSAMSKGANQFGKGLVNAGSSLFGSDAPAPIAGGMDAADLESMPMMMAADGGGVGDVLKQLGPLAMLMAARGGRVPALLSPGEKVLDPKGVEKVAKGSSPMEVGKTVPGKPKVGGAKNSYANDTVKAAPEEGSIVIPRSITQGKNPEKKSAEFVAAVLKRQALKKDK